MIALRTFEDDRNEQDQIRSGLASYGPDTWGSVAVRLEVKDGWESHQRRSVMSE
jgi:hypothetical protein